MAFVQIGDADGKVRFERLPMAIDEAARRRVVAVKHGLDAGQKIVVNGAVALSQKS